MNQIDQFISPERLCGVAEYIISAGRLDGTWTVAKLDGKLGKEVAVKSPDEDQHSLAGNYDVSIYDPTGEEIYQGKLNIEKNAECFNMEWSGGGKTYIGIGIPAGPDRLAAFYWVHPDSIEVE